MHGEGEYTKRPNDLFLSIVQIPERNVAASMSNTHAAQEQHNQVASVGAVYTSRLGERSGCTHSKPGLSATSHVERKRNVK